MTKQIANYIIFLEIVFLNSCSVQDISRSQMVCNFTKRPLLVSAGKNSGTPHYSPKVKTFFGLFAWGDASIYSAKRVVNATDDYDLNLIKDEKGNITSIIGKVSTIDEERKLFLGCGFYRIILTGYYR